MAQSPNWCIDNLFVGSSEMTFGPTTCGKLLNVIMLNVIWANQKTEYIVFFIHLYKNDIHFL